MRSALRYRRELHAGTINSLVIKERRAPATIRHNIKACLDAYIQAAGLAGDRKGYLFRNTRGRTRQLTSDPLAQADVYRMIRRKALGGIRTRIGNHTFRATGITQYLRNGGRRELAQQWLLMSRRARRRCMIGGMTKWRWMR